MKTTFSGVASVIAIVIAITVPLLFGGGDKSFGGTTQSSFTANGGFKAGSAGTLVTEWNTGTCNAATTALPLEATSTDAFTCSASGVVAGQQCYIALPAYDLSFGSMISDGVTASTDSITFGITNNTGAATSSFPLATTSVAYWCAQD